MDFALGMVDGVKDISFSYGRNVVEIDECVKEFMAACRTSGLSKKGKI